MAGFKGQAEYSVDSKGRVAIPAKMRSTLNPEAKKTFTITRGLDHCLYLYPLDTWEEKEKEMARLNMYDRETRSFVRGIMRWADEVSLDSQGRITLPKNLVELAGISDRAIIIGSFEHIEIWSPEAFDAYLNEQAADYETLAERVMG